MQYSMPSLIDSGVSPFHQIGAGKATSTVSCPGFAGLAIGIDPFSPISSQLPIMFAAKAGAASPMTDAATTATSIRLLSAIMAILPHSCPKTIRCSTLHPEPVLGARGHDREPD